MNIIRNKELSYLAKELIRLMHQHELGSLGRLVIGLAGGSSILPILATLEQETALLERLDIFLVDERIADSTERNAAALIKYLADCPHLNLPDHSGADAKAIAENYSKKLKACGGRFQLLVLGVGEDGHIASIFPQHPGFKISGQGYAVIENSPKPPQTRISLTAESIRNADSHVLLFFGENKRQALENFLNQEVSLEACPAKLVLHGQSVTVLTDLGKL
ncbi:6-phosphogluconolactonase [bacterium]|nr:6-phosphogluconolactonase [bacterium]